MAQARLWFQRAADQGFAEGQRRLGRLYDWVDPSANDDAQAALRYALAAQQGDAVAQNNLGLLYLRGAGVPESLERGLALLKQAADQGYALAQFNLGDRFDHGHDGVPEDPGAAALWFTKGAGTG